MSVQQLAKVSLLSPQVSVLFGLFVLFLNLSQKTSRLELLF